MLLVIPSLKLGNGKNLLVIKGKEGSQQYYNELSNNPVEFCKLIRSENFKTIHIDIIDSIDNNFDVLKNIAESLDIPIQVRSDFQSINQCKKLLDNGIYRIIISDLVITQKNEIKKMIDKYSSSRIAGSVFSDNNIVNLKNLKKSYSVFDYINLLKQTGIQRIILSSNDWKINTINFLKDILANAEVRTTLYNVVNSAQQLWELDDLKHYGVDSVIINESFYLNKFPCQNMWREIEGQLKSFAK